MPGQTCSGIERAYVMRDVADRFVDGVVREAGRLTVGNPLEWTTEIGPMVSKEQYDLVCELVDDAIASGAKRLCGGPREVPGFSGHFIAPTVLTDVTHDMRIMREEIFGPVLPIMTVDSEQEAIDLANDSRVRARRFGVDARPRQGRANRPADPVGHGLDQRPLVHARRVPVLLGRREGVRPRPLALEVRVLRVHEHQAGVLGAVPDARHLVAPVRRGAREGDPRLGASCSTAATACAAEALREGAVPLLRVLGRSMRRG